MPPDPPDLFDVAALRRDYASAGFDEDTAAANPLSQFATWLTAAVEAGIPEPNAMVLATADAQGAPSGRTVLLKGIDDRGFVFFTNSRSRKGRELAANPAAALVFPWIAIGRQVTARGTVRGLDAAASDGYFAQRPRGSQLAAWASLQSETLSNRAPLEAAVADVERRFGEDHIPRPPHWGGYRLEPHEIEFWQGRADRLHDRLQYTRTDDGWSIQRLWP
jgi:pyridoxamine 5'-phosphate oxidase